MEASNRTGAVRSLRQNMHGILVTLITIAAIESLNHFVTSIPNPAVLYLTAVVYTAFCGGLAPGLVSAAITLLYALYFFSIPHQLLHYSPDNLKRILVLLVATPAITCMAGILKARSDKAGAALRQSEIKYRTIFENTQDVFYLTDLDGNILDISPSVQRYSGYRREELLGRSTDLFYHHPEDRLRFLDRLKKTGEVTDYEVRMKTKDDRLVIISVNAHLQFDSSGRPHGIEGSLRDITERKKAEQKIHTYSQYLEQLLSISRGMISTTEPGQLYRFTVLAAKELLGLDYSTLMLLSLDKKSLVIQDTVGFPEAMIGQYSLVEGQGLSTYVVKNRKPDTVCEFGRETRFDVPDIVLTNHIRSAVCVPMMLKNEILGVLIGHTKELREFSNDDLSLYQNIANQAAIAINNARNLESVRLGEKKLHDITSHMAEGLYVIDCSGRVTFVNEEAVRLLGWTQEELNEKGAHELIHCKRSDGSPLPREDCGVHCVIRSGRQYVSTEDVFVRRDGTVFPVSIASSPIIENDRIVAAVTAFRDITELKRLEEEAAKVKKLESIGILAGGIAHDFNNLLQNIWGYISLAKTPHYTNKKRTDILSHAEKSCASAADLSYRLLTFSEGGKPVRKLSHIQGLLRDTVAGFVSSSPVRTNLVLPPDLPRVPVDEGQMKQVFRNIIQNAMDAMPGGGVLEIAGESMQVTGEESLPLKPGAYLKVAFIDSGAGIPPERLPRIFDPYFTTKEMGGEKGMGLGLSICYSIIRKHDGLITVSSQPGKGTTATIYLPVTERSVNDAARGIPVSGLPEAFQTDQGKP